MLKQTNSQNVNTETYNDKYQALVNSPPPSSYDETISDLENKIEAIQEPNQPQKITTPSNDQRPVLGEDPVARYKSFFSERQLNPLAVDETLFDQLVTSTELASVRLAEEARNELKTALVGPLSVNITQLRAEELAKDLTQEINVVTKNLEKEKYDLLQFVERFTTPAGILAMRRLIGKQIKPSLDFLINLWRRDALTEPWQTNIFK